MLLSLFSTLLIIRGCTAELKEYTYVEKPMTFDDAKLYCAAEGAELAIVLTDEDRVDAIAVIPDGTDAPWIGLEKEGAERDGREIWSYPKLGNDACPHSFQEYGCGKCVVFWVDNEPIEDSNDCTVFYKEEYGGKVNNDVVCTEQRPFICHNFDAGICGTEDFDCYRTEPLLNCGRSVRIPGFITSRCFCDHDATGNSKCISSVYCSWAGNNKCSSDADCEDSEICTVTPSCCGYSHCAPLCDQWDSRRRLVAEEKETRRLAEEPQGDCEPTSFDACDE
eukprot:32829_1